MKTFLTLIFLVSMNSYADSKSKIRWPAQDSPVISRDIIQCDFPKNDNEIASIEIFASVKSKGSQITLSNISSIVSVKARGGFKALSTGGNLSISDSMDLSGEIVVAGSPAKFSYVKGSALININGNESKASQCVLAISKKP